MEAALVSLLEASKSRTGQCPHWDANTCIGGHCPEIDLCEAVRGVEEAAARTPKGDDSNIVLKARLWYETQKKFQNSLKREKKAGAKRSELTAALWDETGVRMEELVEALKA